MPFYGAIGGESFCVFTIVVAINNLSQFQLMAGLTMPTCAPS